MTQLQRSFCHSSGRSDGPLFTNTVYIISINVNVLVPFIGKVYFVDPLDYRLWISFYGNRSDRFCGHKSYTKCKFAERSIFRNVLLPSLY